MLLTCGTTSKRVLAQLVAKVAGHAVEQRIARGQHDRPLAAKRREFVDGLVEVAASDQPLGLRRRALWPSVASVPIRSSASSINSPGRRRYAVEPVVADADDVDLACRGQEYLLRLGEMRGDDPNSKGSPQRAKALPANTPPPARLLRAASAYEP